MNQTLFICLGCASGSAEQNCPKHGKEFLDFKVQLLFLTLSLQFQISDDIFEF